eukprot:6174263-Pleurochrysis_carterae.AAC.1
MSFSARAIADSTSVCGMLFCGAVVKVQAKCLHEIESSCNSTHAAALAQSAIAARARATRARAICAIQIITAADDNHYCKKNVFEIPYTCTASTDLCMETEN